MHTPQGTAWGTGMLDQELRIIDDEGTTNFHPDVDQAAAARLKRARIEGGYRTAVDFARALGINITTYHHHENGRRGIPEDAARRYAKALDLNFSSLLFGDELQKVAAVPIVGVIHGRGEITLMKDTNTDLSATLSAVDEAQESTGNWSGVTLQKIHVPDFTQMETLVVQGNELYPAYREGDAVLHYPLVRIDRMPSEWHGVECVCKLADGKRLLRQVMVQPDGGTTLVSYSGAPMFNAPVVGASPVEWVRRYHRSPEP